MSTRSNIYLKLKSETKGKTLKFDFFKLPRRNGEQHAELEFPIKNVKVPKNAAYMHVYHHWDGYITGVGQTLLESYTDYDTILNLLTMGDLSSINGGVTSYQGWRNEKTPPKFIRNSGKIKVNCWSKRKKGWVVKYKQMCDANGDLDPKEAIREEYAYLFDGEKWWASYYRWDDNAGKSFCTGWLDLESELKREKAEIEERVKARTNA